MRFDLDRLPTDPVLLHKMLREMADVMAQERAELKAARATVKVQDLKIEKLEHRLARLLRVQFGRSSEKMDIAQLRLMFDEVEAPEPANDDGPVAAQPVAARRPGTRAPRPVRAPRAAAAPKRRSPRTSPKCSIISRRASG
jgi:transposase